MQAGDGKLYGTTYAGGNIYPGNGVLFSFDPSTSTFTKLKDFDNTNGMSIYSSLMQASNGNLYGISDFGVIFSFNPSASTYAKLTDLNINDGRDPYSSLVQASDGKLYGMTDDGGSGSYPDGRGVIFSYDPLTSLYAKLADFTGYNGRRGLGSLIQATNGKLYGMAWSGGPDNTDGVVFSYDLSSSRYTKLLNFDGTHGAHPYGSLMQAGNGKLYGMTYDGGTGSGVLFL